MSQDVIQPFPVLAAVATYENDPRKITNLIEQLDRDLTETQQTASQS
jgi:hypothetical protein